MAFQIAVEFHWGDDGRATRFERGANGSWYANGFQPMSPKQMLEHIELWVESTYKVPREQEAE